MNEEILKLLTDMLAKLDAKAAPLTKGEERDADPVGYLLKKSRTEAGIDDPMDKHLLWKLTKHVLAEGLRD